MAIANFPASLQPIIQQNFLQREFEQGLRSRLAYRSAVQKEKFPIKIGQTLTMTRAGLKAPVTTPLNPSLNTNLDNGLTSSSFSVEQYTMTLGEYADTIDLNVINDNVGLAKQFIQNTMVNALQASQSLERLARNALFDAYMSGNTRVRVTLGAPGTALTVDDIRGFQTVLVNGVVTPVSVTNTLAVTINGDPYFVSAAVADVVNISTALPTGGISGTLTLTGNVTVLDGTANNPVISLFAPSILRPNGRATTANLITTDLLTLDILLDAVSILRSNNVPTLAGQYHCYLDDRSMRQLFSDPAFQLLFRGEYKSDEYQNARVIDLLDLRFISTTEAPQQTISNVKIHRPLIVGADVAVEGTFAALKDSAQNMAGNGHIEIIDDVAQVLRPMLDRLQQIIAQSWYWIGGYSIPSDATATTSIIPTANNAYFKRGVMIEVGGV